MFSSLQSMCRSGLTSRGVILLFGTTVYKWELVKLAGGILLLSMVVHEGDPVDLAGGIRLFGAAVHEQKNITINLGVNR